ncbi:MAG: hypothetical protein DI538_21815 [Azospira oryzae]|jgi:hypothetical protein|nr:MAG: hypothetical protein DI538_21815 [Azospira oryzae]
MTIFNEFKENIFRVLGGYMSLEAFAQWLYGNEVLSNMMMTNDSVLMAYEFNYGKPGAKYEFRAAFSGFFNDEFLLWKVKSNLSELIAGTSRADLIVSDFYKLGDQGYPWAYSIGYYEYLFDSGLYDYEDRDESMQDLKAESRQLLSLIIDQEKERANFKLSDFTFPARDELAIKTKFTANFWK